jgi:hypothetical protein
VLELCRLRHRQVFDDVAKLQSVEGRRVGNVENLVERRQVFAAVQHHRLDDDAAAAGTVRNEINIKFTVGATTSLDTASSNATLLNAVKSSALTAFIIVLSSKARCGELES